jgi:myotubularin-related protein 6/7/8
LKSGGFEDSRYYRNTDIIFCDIDNIHEVNKSYSKLQVIPSSPEVFHSVQYFVPLVEGSGYLNLISRILKATNMVVETMLFKGNNVLVHCSDGWDRTAQICALV